MANPTNATAYALPDGRLAVNVTENKTLGADDTGYVQNVIVDGVVLTLPSVGPGLSYAFRNGGAAPSGGPSGAVSDQSVGFQISPAAADKIQGGVDGTATANKDLINAKATSKVGDFIAVQGGATTAWTVEAGSRRGVWTREA